MDTFFIKINWDYKSLLRVFFVIPFFFACNNSIAQLNESDTAKFQVRASLTGNYQQGNVELLAIRSKLDIVARFGNKFVFKSQNSSLYQDFFQQKIDNDLFSRNYLYYQPQKRVYPFLIAYVSANHRRKIDTRFFGGLGVTYQVVRKPSTVVKLSATLVYEETHFANTSFNYTYYDGSKKINLFRSTLYSGGWIYVADKRLRIFYDAFWQPSFNQNFNYRVQVDTGIDFPIWKGVAFTALYSFTHEQVVSKNIKQQDKILSFGLSYQLKKKK